MVLFAAFFKRVVLFSFAVLLSSILPGIARAVDVPFTETALIGCQYYYLHGVICHLEEKVTTGYEEREVVDDDGNPIRDWDPDSYSYRTRTEQVPIQVTTQIYVQPDGNKTCRGDMHCWEFPPCPEDPTKCGNFLPSWTATVTYNDSLGLAMEFLSADFRELAGILERAMTPYETKYVATQRLVNGKWEDVSPKLNADGTITVVTEPSNTFYIACGTDNSTRNKNETCYQVTKDFLILALGNVHKIIAKEDEAHREQQQSDVPPVPAGTQTVGGVSAAPKKGEGVATAVTYCTSPQPDCDTPYKDWYTRLLNAQEMDVLRNANARQCQCTAGDPRCAGTPPTCTPAALDALGGNWRVFCGTIYDGSGNRIRDCNGDWWQATIGANSTCQWNYLAHWYFYGVTERTGGGDFAGCPHVHCCKLSQVAEGSGDCPFREICSEDRAVHGCFDPKTKIRMADGSEKSMLELQAHDAVYNPLLKKGVKILRLITGPEAKDLVEVGVRGKKVLVSSTHPFYVKGANGHGPNGSVLRRAVDLSEADELLSEDGAFHKIETLKKVPPAPGQIVVNVELEGGEQDGESHLLLADGVLAGDYTLQALLNR